MLRQTDLAPKWFPLFVTNYSYNPSLHNFYLFSFLHFMSFSTNRISISNQINDLFKLHLTIRRVMKYPELKKQINKDLKDVFLSKLIFDCWLVQLSVISFGGKCFTITILFRGSQPFSYTYPLRTPETFHIPPGCKFSNPHTPNIIIYIPRCYNLHTLKMFEYPLELFAHLLGLKYPRLRNPDVSNKVILHSICSFPILMKLKIYIFSCLLRQFVSKVQLCDCCVSSTGRKQEENINHCRGQWYKVGFVRYVQNI